MTLIKLTGKKPKSWIITDKIKDIFPDKHHYINIYFDNIIKLSFNNNIMITAKEFNKLNKLIQIISLSYDKDMNRIVIMGVI